MKFGVVFKEGNEKAEKLFKQISDYLSGKNHEVAGPKDLEGSDFILTIGGDGTLIHYACEYAELGIPFVGINVGRLGFLTAIEGENWKQAVEKLEKGEVFISERISLEAKVDYAHPRGGVKETSGKHLGGESRVFRAVNEVVIKGLYRVIALDVKVDSEKLVKITGDGVIVATQTGSTAYSLSAGGPIVDPDLDSLLITPINPIGFPIPSVVVSPDNELAVKLEAGDDVSLIIDGQEHTKLAVGDEVFLLRGLDKIKFAYFDKHHFFKALNAKFGLSSRGSSD